MVSRLADCGLVWPCQLSDVDLEAALYAPPVKEVEEMESLVVPDWGYVHQEFRRRDYH